MTDSSNKPTEVVSLKMLCIGMKIDTRDARIKLRSAVKNPKRYPVLSKSYVPRQPWQWAKDSLAHKEAVKALTI